MPWTTVSVLLRAKLVEKCVKHSRHSAGCVLTVGESRTLALDEFFEPANTTFASHLGLDANDYLFDILFNICFKQNGLVDPAICTGNNPLSRLLERDKIRS